jgi:hypothetical protein
MLLLRKWPPVSGNCGNKYSVISLLGESTFKCSPSRLTTVFCRRLLRVHLEPHVNAAKLK